MPATPTNRSWSPCRPPIWSCSRTPSAAGRPASGYLTRAKVGRNPGRIIPWVYYGFAAEADPARSRQHPRRTRLSRPHTAEEYPACVQHEAACNLMFAGRASRALCPYDVSNLDPDIIADARTTHPLLVDAGIRRASPDYADPHAVAAAFNRPLPDLGRPLLSLDFDATSVRRPSSRGRATRGVRRHGAGATHGAARRGGRGRRKLGRAWRWIRATDPLPAARRIRL